MDEAVAIAKYFSYKFKIVTLDGDVLNAGGSITGGSSSSKGTDILSRRRELEDTGLEIRNLETRLKKLHKEKENVEKQLIARTEKFNEMEHKITKLNMELAIYREKLQGLNRNINNLKVDITDNKKKVKYRRETKCISITTYFIAKRD